jgi:hypothetical protein
LVYRRTWTENAASRFPYGAKHDSAALLHTWLKNGNLIKKLLPIQAFITGFFFNRLDFQLDD